jgi:hypothetical protein
MALRRQSAKSDRKVGAVLDDQLTQPSIRSRSEPRVLVKVVIEVSLLSVQAAQLFSPPT